MRRHLLHITVALFAFALGFLFAAPYRYLAYALPLAALVFVLAKTLPGLDVDLHFVCVVAMSLLFWSAGGFALLGSPLMHSDCVVDFGSEDDSNTAESDDNAHANVSEESDDESFSGITAYTCGNDANGDDAAARSSIWAGVINGKALSKPAPVYPSFAKSARVMGTVAVSVLVDESGKVTQTQALSGHALLRQSALDAACRATFSPTLIDGPTVKVSGILTYNFDF
ncbi:MAG: energy transducer TonB [Rubrivivax sp.]|nr:energy transducer TonB [Pyrinomonadaceae bacterium]